MEDMHKEDKLEEGRPCPLDSDTQNELHNFNFKALINVLISLN